MIFSCCCRSSCLLTAELQVDDVVKLYDLLINLKLQPNEVVINSVISALSESLSIVVIK